MLRVECVSMITGGEAASAQEQALFHAHTSAHRTPPPKPVWAQAANGGREITSVQPN